LKGADARHDALNVRLIIQRYVRGVLRL
jgi:hypothetical protein